MKQALIPFLMLFLLCLPSKAQDTLGVAVPDNPVSLAEEHVIVKTKGVTYRYTEISVIPVPGKENMVTDDVIRKYQPYAAVLRDSLLWGKGKQAAVHDMQAVRAAAAMSGTLPDVDWKDDFDVTKVTWRDKEIAVDAYAGVYTAMPLGFLSGYSSPAYGFTCDSGVYIKNTFVRIPLSIGAAFSNKEKHMFGGAADGRIVPNYKIAINIGQQFSIRKRFSLSPFVGCGFDWWLYSIDHLDYTIKGGSLSEGIEIVAFLHKSVCLSTKDPHVNNLAIRMRIYSDQILGSNELRKISPSINASLCVGIYRRNIGR